jgi:hypothetical protein
MPTKPDVVDKCWMIACLVTIIALVLINCGHPWIGLAIAFITSLTLTCITFLF